VADEINDLNQGIAAADGPDKTREYADVAKWRTRIDQARRHDEEARKQYARDRRYARGDSGFQVDANLIGTNIDILESFLYAKDPDVDVQPGLQVRPPGVEAIREAVEMAFDANPDALALVKQTAAEQAMPVANAASWQALSAGQDPAAATQGAFAEASQVLEQQVRQQLIDEQVADMQHLYAKRKREMEAYAETLEILISHLWRDASLKTRGRRVVRSGLTIGIGVLKASWQERTAPSAETVQKARDLQDNIRRAAALRAKMQDQSGSELDATLADYRRQLKALQGEAEQVIARGFVVDQVRGEDFQVAPGWAIADHLDAPWNAHRIPMLKADAKAEFSLTTEQIAQATSYSARKPETVRTTSALVDQAVESVDADAYTAGAVQEDGNGDWCMVWEIWDQQSSTVLTLIEGVKCWVKPAWQPTATTRFYPFFVYTTSEVDGERHPQSLVTRSAKLVDEYNRIGSAEAEHRRRILPRLMFDGGALSPADAKKVTDGTVGETIALNPTKPGTDLRTLFAEVNYPVLNPAIYDRARIVGELERIWGIQEALSGSIQTAKTATEAEIQQSGFTARTGGRRDLLEAMLQDLAQYTAENARAHLDTKDVVEICGPDAVWPPYEGAADLAGAVEVEIRAGSSGKPNTSAERAAWASQLPLLQNAIKEIGTLRNSSPADVADALEELLRITAERSGDRLNIDRLIPKAGPAPVPMPGAVPGADPDTPVDPAAPPSGGPVVPA
jgi:hypothetical protein